MLRALLAAVMLLGVGGCKRDPAPAPLELNPTSIRLKPSAGKLTALLSAEVAKARARNLKPFLELRAEWCEPCKELEASMHDARMIDAFAGTYLISADLDEWDQELPAAGFNPDGVPVFFELDAQAKPTGRKIDGGAWAQNIPANMAPPLKAFFAAK
jgi:thiol:disulfide interchange protein